MVNVIWEAIKSLFGGSVQVGRENVKATSSGVGSAVAVNGSVFIGVSGNGQRDEDDRDVLGSLEQPVQHFLSEIVLALKEKPMLRDILVTKTKGMLQCCNWRPPALGFSEDENPDIRSVMAILVGRYLVREIKDGFAYRLSEELVAALKNGSLPQK